MVGITFEDGLIDRILDETGGGRRCVAGVQLQNLAERAQMTRITRQRYEESGGVGHAAQQADGAFASWAGTASRDRCSRPAASVT